MLRAADSMVVAQLAREPEAVEWKRSAYEGAPFKG